MLDKNEIIIIDDVFGEQVQNLLYSWLTAADSAWFFSKDIAFADDVIARGNHVSKYGFSKTFFSLATNAQTPLFNTIFPLILEACDKINFNVEQTLFSRSFLTTPIPSSDSIYDHIHVDLIEPHLVSLYYVNDSDGDTVFFDKCIDDYFDRPDIKSALDNVDFSKPGPGPLEIVDSLVDKSEFKIYKTVTPKKGRMVFFNGYRYHTSTRPSNGHRIVINNNLRGQFKNK
jgi:hypothetical protein